MLKYFPLILLFFLASSCDRYPDPGYSTIEDYSFSFINKSDQKHVAGDIIDGTVRCNTSYTSSVSPDSFLIEFDVISGGGSVSKSSVYSNNSKLAKTDWQLGTDSFEQVLRASVYTVDGKLLTKTDYITYAYRTGQWDEFSGSPDGQMTGMVADTVNKLTLMITGNTIYRQGSRYYEWEPVSHPALVSPRTIEIDGNGVIYASTWNGEVVKSTDHGESWKKCTKPYPDHPYYIFMYVSNDNWIWAYKFDYPTKYSKDGGVTWIEAGSGLSSYGYGDVFRLKNGTLIFHGSNCCSLSRSDDDGATWTHIETPGYSHKLYVNEKDELFICNQENGVTILRSTDMGATWQRLYNVYPQFGTTMDNVFNKYGSYYYIQIPGFGVLKSADLIKYDQLYLNNQINNLFIDHNGVMFVKDWNSNTVWCLKSQ
jgi:hypothetical protein